MIEKPADTDSNLSNSFLVMAYTDCVNAYFFFDAGIVRAVRTLDKAKRMTLEKAEECRKTLIQRYEARHDMAVLTSTFTVIEV